ncbi:hypothetical protein [Thalassotalea sp. PS06]|uniref:hypothetical protein n=1 Tax=Thalassotalea sp. PS06 TaxID=2594005 RepID=UPI00116308DA|nr:hypothetical protein [Thalassotalea sp. PS06]QDP02430.1 hypothetical protein FNC98_14385 [Thalassotalea sp. PS06]
MKILQIEKYRWPLLTAILWLHISLIDLMLLTVNGTRLLWQQNLTFKAFAVHLSIALVSTLVIWLTYRLQLRIRQNIK